MSLTIEVDIKEALDKINQKLDKIDEKVDNLSIDMATVKTKLEGIEKRIDNQEFISRGVLIGLIVAIVGGFAKLFGFVGNP
jgi:tetrahydromethanopterin S-methyltransferase subunit G